jgi:hypothetical protein
MDESIYELISKLNCLSSIQDAQLENGFIEIELKANEKTQLRTRIRVLVLEEIKNMESFLRDIGVESDSSRGLEYVIPKAEAELVEAIIKAADADFVLGTEKFTYSAGCYLREKQRFMSPDELVEWLASSRF